MNTYGSPYSQLKLTHLSQAMGIDVTAYDFRRIVATWALSHESEEIRNAESETLRHGNKVAYDHYVQNKYDDGDDENDGDVVMANMMGSLILKQ